MDYAALVQARRDQLANLDSLREEERRYEGDADNTDTLLEIQDAIRDAEHLIQELDAQLALAGGGGAAAAADGFSDAAGVPVPPSLMQDADLRMQGDSPPSSSDDQKPPRVYRYPHPGNRDAPIPYSLGPAALLTLLRTTPPKALVPLFQECTFKVHSWKGPATEQNEAAERASLATLGIPHARIWTKRMKEERARRLKHPELVHDEAYSSRRVMPMLMDGDEEAEKRRRHFLRSEYHGGRKHLGLPDEPPEPTVPGTTHITLPTDRPMLNPLGRMEEFAEHLTKLNLVNETKCAKTLEPIELMSLIRQCEEYIHDANDLRVLHTREEARCEHHGYVDKTSERFMQRFFYPVHVTGRKNVQALAGMEEEWIARLDEPHPIPDPESEDDEAIKALRKNDLPALIRKHTADDPMYTSFVGSVRTTDEVKPEALVIDRELGWETWKRRYRESKDKEQRKKLMKQWLKFHLHCCVDNRRRLKDLREKLDLRLVRLLRIATLKDWDEASSKELTDPALCQRKVEMDAKIKGRFQLRLHIDDDDVSPALTAEEPPPPPDRAARLLQGKWPECVEWLQTGAGREQQRVVLTGGKKTGKAQRAAPDRTTGPIFIAPAADWRDWDTYYPSLVLTPDALTALPARVRQGDLPLQAMQEPNEDKKVAAEDKVNWIRAVTAFLLNNEQHDIQKHAKKRLEKGPALDTLTVDPAQGTVVLQLWNRNEAFAHVIQALRYTMTGEEDAFRGNNFDAIETQRDVLYDIRGTVSADTRDQELQSPDILIHALENLHRSTSDEWEHPGEYSARWFFSITNLNARHGFTLRIRRSQKLSSNGQTRITILQLSFLPENAMLYIPRDVRETRSWLQRRAIVLRICEHALVHGQVRIDRETTQPCARTDNVLQQFLKTGHWQATRGLTLLDDEVLRKLKKGEAAFELNPRSLQRLLAVSLEFHCYDHDQIAVPLDTSSPSERHLVYEDGRGREFVSRYRLIGPSKGNRELGALHGFDSRERGALVGEAMLNPWKRRKPRATKSVEEKHPEMWRKHAGTFDSEYVHNETSEERRDRKRRMRSQQMLALHRTRSSPYFDASYLSDDKEEDVSPSLQTKEDKEDDTTDPYQEEDAEEDEEEEEEGDIALEEEEEEDDDDEDGKAMDTSSWLSPALLRSVRNFYLD